MKAKTLVLSLLAGLLAIALLSGCGTTEVSDRLGSVGEAAGNVMNRDEGEAEEQQPAEPETQTTEQETAESTESPVGAGDYLGEGVVLGAFMWEDGGFSETQFFPADVLTQGSEDTNGEWELDPAFGTLDVAEDEAHWTDQVIVESHPAAEEELEEGRIVLATLEDFAKSPEDLAESVFHRVIVKSTDELYKDIVTVDYIWTPGEEDPYDRTEKVHIANIRIADEPELGTISDLLGPEPQTKAGDYIEEGVVHAAFWMEDGGFSETHFFPADVITEGTEETNGEWEVATRSRSLDFDVGHTIWTDEVILESHPATKEDLEPGTLVLVAWDGRPHTEEELAGDKFLRGFVANTDEFYKDMVGIELRQDPENSEEATAVESIPIANVRVVDEPAPETILETWDE
jgi:hypothetical protein